jgi:phage terminase large subunit|tara:strand:+ start:1271 stop:2236 length:966 start_codon:yes stop_codon:yes gene_type:complete
MRDMIEILEKEGYYNVEDHNKSDQTYNLFGNTLEFISLDQPQKVRGRKRNILFINEANEIDFESWTQLSLRTTDKIIIDYNPSDEFHWIYEKVMTRDDAEFFKSTYMDNPFLPDSTIQEIERLKDADENYWRVYGLGERGKSRSLVFDNVGEVDRIPENSKEISFGLDFGYSNDPTTLIRIHQRDNELYFEELIYSTGLTNQDICEEFRSLEIRRTAEIFADSAEPKSIEEIYRQGYNIKPTKKGKDSIKVGIDLMRSHKLFVTSGSLNLIKEFRNYKYKEDKNQRILNEPIDRFNHGIDAIRYGLIMKLQSKYTGEYEII